MKLYSVIMGFGFMLLAATITKMDRCKGQPGLATCVHFAPDGKPTPGYYCTGGGQFGNCGMISNCVPSM